MRFKIILKSNYIFIQILFSCMKSIIKLSIYEHSVKIKENKPEMN